MKKRVLIISSSPRKGGNSETLAASFASGAEEAVQGWVDCFPRCTLAGTVFAGGVNEVGDITGRPALEQAYQMGREI